MTDMERKTFCAALSRYGAQAQITMVFEKMAELQDVLCKFLRGRVDGDTLANIAEEIADVGIMLDQMVIDFEVEDAVAEQRASKVRRLRSLLICPARLYGTVAKLCDMESLCEDVYRAKDAELALDALQELVDKGLGGRFIDLRKTLKGVEL